MSAASVSDQNRAHGSSEAENFNSALHPSQDILDYVREYAAQKPEIAALWCFGIGFILGWKLKPW